LVFDVALSQLYNSSALVWYHWHISIVTVGNYVLFMLLQLLLAAWINVLGAVGRIISTLLPDNCRYAVLLSSQTVCACAQPFMMFSPTKLAAQWFHEHQRTFANMIASIGNTVYCM